MLFTKRSIIISNLPGPNVLSGKLSFPVDIYIMVFFGRWGCFNPGVEQTQNMCFEMYIL